jgi:hypothetical protein
VVNVRLKVDANRATAGLTNVGYFELIDPCGHAIDRCGRYLAADRHLRTAAGRSSKLRNEQRTFAITGYDPGFAIAKSSGYTDELQLECAALEVETRCSVNRAMTTAPGATRLKDLHRDFFHSRRTRVLGTHAWIASSAATRAQRHEMRQRNGPSNPHSPCLKLANQWRRPQ